MKVRRTISINKEDFDTLKPILNSNGNNLSLALRQVINDYSQRNAMSGITGDQQRMIMLRNQIIETRVAVLIPVPLIKWLVRKNLCVPPLGTFRIVIEKYTKLLGVDGPTLNDFIKMINTHVDILGYQLRLRAEVSPDSRNIRISFEGEDADHLKGSVINYSCLLAHHPLKLKTKRFVESPSLIIVDYEQCSSEDEAYRSVMEHFGHNQSTFEEILNNIQFWRNVVNILKADRYENIILSKDVFSSILKSREFSEHLSNIISIIHSVHIEDTDYKSITRYIEEICKTNGLIYRMENNDNEVKIYHTFDDKEIIRTVNETIIKTLSMAGQHFVLKKGDKMTILSRK